MLKAKEAAEDISKNQFRATKKVPNSVKLPRYESLKKQ